MPSLTSELFGVPTSARETRCLEAASERVADVLAGRTVWFASALASVDVPAESLREHLGWGGVPSEPLTLSPDEPLRVRGERLDAMLRGSGTDPQADRLDADDRDAWAAVFDSSESLAGGDVRQEDVVVLGDVLTAMLAEALRENGAHVVWRVTIAPGGRQAWEFLRGYTMCVDAYLVATPAHGRAQVEGVAAVMPSPGVVAAKEFPPAGDWAGDHSRDIGWSAALAEVVRSDRDETVGGTVRARPAVPLR
jgi:hypothetical protein